MHKRRRSHPSRTTYHVLVAFVSFVMATVVSTSNAGADASNVALQGHAWAGLEVANSAEGNVWGVSGSFMVPNLFCAHVPSKSTTYLSTWIGIGGTSPDNTLYQTGVNTKCVGPHEVIEAFDEKFVNGAHNAGPKCLGTAKCYPVSAGDLLTAHVLRATNDVITSITDTRKGARLWSDYYQWPIGTLDNHVAECVVEDPIKPNAGVVHEPMAQFSTVNFSSCGVLGAQGAPSDMNLATQPNGWTRQILNMRNAAGSILTSTKISPLRVSLRGSKSQGRPTSPSTSAPTTRASSPSPGSTSGTWSAQDDIDGTNRFSDISCATGPWCVAVDDNGDAVDFNGSSWSAPVNMDPGGEILKVSCPVNGFCVSVDSIGNTFLDEDGNWSRSSLTGDNVSSVSCVSSDLCIAVESYGSEYVYANQTWSEPNLIDGGGNGLASVSCPTQTFCEAVGSNAVTYNNGTWSTPENPDDSGDTFRSISCPTAVFCMAVDDTGNALTLQNGSWSKPLQIDNDVDDDTGGFNTVSCPSQTFCMAVDQVGNSFVYNGSSWRQVGSGEGGQRVSCPTVQLCVAVNAMGQAQTYKP